MKNLLKNILSIPIIYIMFALLFIIGDIVFGIIFLYIPYFILAIIPTAIIWFVLQYSATIYVLKRFISNGIYYLIIQFLILGHLTFVKYISYLWCLQTHKIPLISVDLQHTIFITELLLGAIACSVIVYTWKRFYK
jgi:hypothetical protein